METSQYERFFNLSNEMLCITSRDGRFVAVNDSWLTALGYERHELVDQPFAQFIHPDDLEQTRAASRALHSGQELIRFQNRYRCKDGSFRWLQWLSSPAVDEGVSYGVARDVTEQVELERQLRNANQARTTFISHMSHELRTPMNAILGFSELLQDRTADRLAPRERQYLTYIREAGTHLLRLINEVLDLARVEAGRVEFRYETVDLRGTIAATIASIELAATEAGVDFAVEVPDDLVISLDAGRLEQILLNLLSNAIKFTPAGGQVRLRAGADGFDLLVIVSDSGIGIPADRQHLVFTPFERPNENRSGAGGTGVGLSLTKQLVERQGGSISFESREGAGTTFTVRLADACRGALRGPRVLVVEDEGHSARLITEHVLSAGMAFEVTGTVDAALAAIDRHPPRGVIVDLRLPGDRGEELIRALHGADGRPSIPVIVASVEDDIPRSLELGADDHLVKPVETEPLLRWLATLDGRHGQAHPAG